MLNITDKHRVFVGLSHIDFRKKLDGTLAVCRQQLQLDPSSGHVFVFRNRKATTLRCIVHEAGGFWFIEKRLSKGKFLYWPDTPYESCELTATQLQQLFNNQAALP